VSSYDYDYDCDHMAIYSDNATEQQYEASGVVHSKHRPVPHYRVLPPGEFIGTIPTTLPIYIFKVS